MIDKHHMERKKVFQPIYMYLLSHGMKENLKKQKLISYICNKYTPSFAQKVLDLWFGVNPYDKINIYYKQDVAYRVDCEEVIEKLETNDEILRTEHDTPFLYKEKFDIKKFSIKIIKSFKYILSKLIAFIAYLVSYMKYIIPIFFMIILLKVCTSNNHTQENETKDKDIVKKEYTANTKKTKSIDEKVRTTTVPHELEKAPKVRIPGVSNDIEKIPSKIITRKDLENKVEPCSYYYTTARVNLRNSASKNATIVRKIKKSKKVCVTRINNSWKYIKEQGWIYDKFLMKDSEYKKNKAKKTKRKKAKVKKKVDRSVWHCEARSQRASGWVERVGKQNSMRGALKQCEMRRQTSSVCRIVNCYRR